MYIIIILFFVRSKNTGHVGTKTGSTKDAVPES